MGLQQQGRATARANYKQLFDFMNTNFRDAAFRHLFLSTSGYESLRMVLAQKCKGLGPSGDAIKILDNTTKLQHLIDDVMNTFSDEAMLEHWIKMKAAHRAEREEGLQSGTIVSRKEEKRGAHAELMRQRRKRQRQGPDADPVKADDEKMDTDEAAAEAPKKKKKRSKIYSKQIG
eukprot:EG_transcript_26212